MNKFTTPLRRKLFFLLIPALIGATYLGSTVFSSSDKKETRVVKVNNLTQSCELLNIQRHKDHIRLSVQNDSTKPITAFVLTSRIDPKLVFTFREEFAFSEGDDVIPPSGSYDKVIDLPSSLNQQQEITLDLSAIIYQDGSSEGDPKSIHDAIDHRLGRKIQIMKVLPTIDKLTRLSDAEIGDYWGRATKEEFGVALDAPNRSFLIQLNKKAPNNDEADNESEQFKLGVKTGKESVIYKYQELTDVREKQGAHALRERLIELKNIYSKIVSQS